MPCTCHGPKGEVVSGKVMPDDPCTVCASKHVNLAASAWNEFTYEWDNRLFAAGHLRLAAEHLRKNHRHLALKARDIAVAIEMVRDRNLSDIAARIKDLQAAVRTAFELEHPDVVRRLDKFSPSPMDAVDVIIPLGPGSLDHENNEIRILLRSLEKHCTGLGRIIVVTDCAPDWLNPDTVCILNMGDRHKDNKDANLIEKTLAAIEQYAVRSFVWAADDNVVMKPLDLRVAPKIYNNRTRASFPEKRRWHERMRHTFDTFPRLKCNFDSHTPQPFRDAQKLARSMRGVAYQEDPGMCIMTTFFASMDDLAGGVDQQDYKLTVEDVADINLDITSMLYLGYGDSGFASIREKLFKIFSEKSRFEK